MLTQQIKEFLSNPIWPLPKDNEYSIAIYFAAHDASITIARGRTILEVLELERFTNLKNINLGGKFMFDKHTLKPFWVKKDNLDVLLKHINQYITKKYTRIFDYGILVDQNWRPIKGSDTQFLFTDYFKVKLWYKISHHMAHAYGAFYQSSYDQSLVVTFDGGSPDGNLNCFLFDRNFSKPVHLFSDTQLIQTTKKTKPFDFGTRYSKYGAIFGDIRYKRFDEFLSYPGKIMGLAGYGTANDFIKLALKKDLQSRVLSKDLARLLDLEHKFVVKALYSTMLQRLKHPVPTNDERLVGQKAYDIAASLQLAFEETVMEKIFSMLKKYQNFPLCYAGGCALNIILNTRLFNEWNNEIFIPPDPNDAGLSHGAMLALTRPNIPTQTAYLGANLLDLDMLSYYLFEEIGFSDKKYVTEEVNIPKLAALIAEGKIIGIARGRSEIGPRALGNRSIVCSVTIPDMKDIINAKVKNREWYRPFAPVVRLEDANKYFEWDRESPYMSFCPLVRKEYIDKIKPVVHVDGTARVQTITKEQNVFLYNLLEEVGKITGYSILLNTSFNVDSNPILNSIKEAIHVLKTTELDGIVIEDVLIMKKTGGDNGTDSMFN